MTPLNSGQARRLLAITALVVIATRPIDGFVREERGLTALAAPPPPQAAGVSTAQDEQAPRSRRPLACYRPSCAYPFTLLPFPSDSLLGKLRVRGGGGKVAPKRTSGTGEGSDAASKPILGPITRRRAADAAGEKGDGGKEDGQQEFAPQFLDFESRVGFMKKVYLTLSIQLVYTGLVCATMRGYRDAILGLLFGHGNLPQILFFISTFVTIISTHTIMWKNPELRQSFPRNLPLLTAYTTAWALYVGVFALMFTKGSVMRAVFQSAFVVGSLTAYAFRTNPKHELTQFGSGLYAAGNALSLFCLMKIFFFRGHRASDLALSCLATLFFSLYLVFDTYRIIGGKHRQSSMFSVKDWAMAAMELYQDIMQIFMHLLSIFGEVQS